jgi:DNA modification methylase
MTVYLQDADLTVYHGDALETLRELPAESVHMCVTSPPFFGLRDYGTGAWEGGDPDCDHVAQRREPVVGSSSTLGFPSDGGPRRIAEGNTYHEAYGQQYRDVCGKCGARRVDQQIGLEATPDRWVASLVAVFRQVHRVLRRDGTLWVEVGDSYAAGKSGRTDAQTLGDYDLRRGHAVGALEARTARREAGLGEIKQRKPPPGMKPKDLVGAPWLLAFALRADGWYLRSDIIWARPNPMPESVTDRPTKSHSYVFLLAKQPRYYFDADAIREDGTGRTAGNNGHVKGAGRDDPYFRTREGFAAVADKPWHARNKRSVWTIPTQPLPDQHYAAYPEALVEPCILAGTSERGVCPECGAPWVRETERQETGRKYTGQRPYAVDGFVRGYEPGQEVAITTTGWRPTCAHSLEPVAATVLDPFGGSGTTALVARRLGRRVTLIELSGDYCALIERRTQQLSLLAVSYPAPQTAILAP